MAINKDSNGYTILFAFILVIVVGGMLAFVSQSLKPMQVENLKNEKKQNILNSIPALKSIQRNDAGGKFEEYVIERMIIDFEGNVIEGTKKTAKDKIDPKDENDAFNLDLLKQFRNKDISEEDKKYPLYICQVEDKKYYVLTFSGKGLWDAIWGFVSVEEDKKTIAGAIFDHKAETPGLGAEINTDKFEDQFDRSKRESNGQKPLLVGFLEGENFTSIQVPKPGSISDEKSTTYEVNGISGGTFTSVGVQNMFYNTIKGKDNGAMLPYYKYFNKS